MHALDLDPTDGFVSNLGSTRDNVLAMIDSGRQRVADLDLTGAPKVALDASRAAIGSARDTIPAGWPGHVRRERSRRWPWIALILLATTLLTFALLAPTVRRWTAGTKVEEPGLQEETGGAGQPAQPVDPGIAPEDTDAG